MDVFKLFKGRDIKWISGLTGIRLQRQWCYRAVDIGHALTVIRQAVATPNLAQWPRQL